MTDDIGCILLVLYSAYGIVIRSNVEFSFGQMWKNGRCWQMVTLMSFFGENIFVEFNKLVDFYIEVVMFHDVAAAFECGGIQIT